MQVYSIAPLEWVDNPEKTIYDIEKVVARAPIAMPHTDREGGNIEISEYELLRHSIKPYYEVRLWCFNRGTKIVTEAGTIEEAKEKAFKWWKSFIEGFLTTK